MGNWIEQNGKGGGAREQKPEGEESWQFLTRLNDFERAL